MDLPEAFFPASVCPHDKRREMFADYGKLLHVDIADIDGKEFRPQTLHPGSKTNLRLAATAPTLPLAKTPNLFVYPFEDRVSGKLIQKRLKAQNFVFRFPKLKYRISKEEKKREQQTKTSWFSSLLDSYSLLQNDPFVPSVNAAYTGGCLAYIGSTDDKEFHLIQAAGKDFNILRHVSVKLDGSTNLLQQNAVVNQLTDSQMFEITSSRVGQDEFCAVRQEFGYQLFKLESRDDGKRFVCLDSRTFMEERLTSLALSPYIKGETLIATDKGSLFLVKPGESMAKLQENWQPRFQCFESWRQCYFAAHPRQFVTADRTAVKLFDSRTQYRELVDLFALPNKSLLHSERVMVAKQQTSCAFHHIVATDASMFIIDQRFPGHPLSHWSFSQKSPPQYISSCDISFIDGIHTNVVAISTQHPAETYCFQIQFGGLSPLQTVSQPWRLSRISDFSKFEAVTSCADMILLQQRFNTSLAGVAVCPAEKQHSFHAFQLDSKGEVFFQTYELNPCVVDKTLSAGPGSREEFLGSVASDRADAWLSGLQKQFVEYCFSNPDLYDVVKYDSRHMIIDVTAERLTHVLCPLCTSEADEQTPGRSDRELVEESVVCENCGQSWNKCDNLSNKWDGLEFMEDADVCQNCGHSLRTPEASHSKQQRQHREFMEGIDVCENCGHSLKISEALYGIRTKDSILGEDCVNLELFNRQVPKLDEIPHSSPNTQILTKLWRRESDIMELVAAREEERKKKRQKRKRLKKLNVTKDKVNTKEDNSEVESSENSEREEPVESEDDFLESNMFDEDNADLKDDSDDSPDSEQDVGDDKQQNKKDNSDDDDDVKQTQVERLPSSLHHKQSVKSSKESILGFYVTPSTSESPKLKINLKESNLVETAESRLLGPGVDPTNTTPQQHRFKSLSGKAEADTKRRRHSSVSSEKSTYSNSSHIGFLGTPPRLKRKDKLWDVGLSDDEESLDLFSQFDTHSFISNPVPSVSPVGFKSPSDLSQVFKKKKFPKPPKKYISGF